MVETTESLIQQRGRLGQKLLGVGGSNPETRATISITDLVPLLAELWNFCSINILETLQKRREKLQKRSKRRNTGLSACLSSVPQPSDNCLHKDYSSSLRKEVLHSLDVFSSWDPCMLPGFLSGCTVLAVSLHIL